MLSPCRPSREIGPESQKRMHSAAGIDSWREERRGGWAGPLQQAWLHTRPRSVFCYSNAFPSRTRVLFPGMPAAAPGSG